MNTLVILLDGAADDKVPELGGMTPLESFDKRFIDGIATSGDFGCTDGKGYTHLFLLELFSGKPLDVPRGLIEAVGLGVPVEPHQVAYRFSPIHMGSDGMEWAYRVPRDRHEVLQKVMIEHLDLLTEQNPRLYFYEDGRGVMTVDSDHVQAFPSPPAPVIGNGVKLGEFEGYIKRIAQDLDGLTVMPWGGGSMSDGGVAKPLPPAKDMVVVSQSPSALGVAGVLNMRRRVVDNMWSGFQESFRLLKTSNVFMHVEETDDISHRRAPDQKVSLLKEVDDILLENVERMMGHRVAFVIDHGTSSVTGQHILMKTPYAAGVVTVPDRRTVRFCESATKYQPLSRLICSLVGK